MRRATEHETGSALSRRELLRQTAVAGLGISAAGALLPSGAAAQQLGALGGLAQPKRGGVLRVGSVGAGGSESFNPAQSSANVIGYLRAYTLFDTLVRLTPDAKLAPALATEWTHNARSTAWEFKLRPGVTFHNGKTMTADDVIYSIQFMASAGNQAAPTVANISLKDLKKKGKNTIVITLKTPDTLFPLNLIGSSNAIVQAGAKNFTHPVGTGAFKFVSLVPGQRSVCARNPDYWDHGKPYVDTLQIISIDDDTARLNALLGGEIDLMAQLPYSQAKAQQSAGQVNLLEVASVVPYSFYVRTDTKPFTDVRVRQALKLIIDRQAMIDVALNGFGSVANDLFGKGLQYYASSIPQRTQDIEQAKSLLKQAGQSDLRVTLNTAAESPGFVEAATLYAQQAKQAGATFNVRTNPKNAYWDPSLLYLKQSFAQTQWNASSLPQFYNYSMAPKASLNETHWHDPKSTKILLEALSATNAKVATERWLEVQKIQWSQGGYITFVNISNLDAASKKVTGITPSVVYSLGMPTGLTNASFA